MMPPLTEAAIEARAEAMLSALDSEFFATDMDADQYRQRCDAISTWVEAAYRGEVR